MTGSVSEGPRRARANPYVGPRPFEPGEKLYGREDEINDLYYRWNAERIVLLHSPSGAGKSSLLQAGLLPRIEKSFDVRGPTRVNQEPTIDGANRYVLSTLEGLEESIPERLRRPPEVLAAQTLAEYVEKRPRRRSAPKNVALLFDQFEEVLTVDPLELNAKREFFDQLGELLHNPRVFALFVLREDYLAALETYARQVSTQLKNRFRIDLLSLDAAREAIVRPALGGGREFPAADQLLHDLATMKVQQPDGSFALETGRHVEPMQLQVVCFRLWDAMPPEHLSIGPEDLERFGNVTEALSGYYADSVTRISGGAMVRERTIRDWFGEKLITTAGIRGQVPRGLGESEGLANDAVDAFLDTHLVRAEKRAGATWYELAHDRLIEPVRESNAAWRAEHLTEVQHQARVWEHAGRPPGLLLADEELAAAERWMAGSAVVTVVERHFLAESRKAQDAADQQRRQARRIQRLAIVASIVSAVALLALFFAIAKSREAERQRDEAERQTEIARQREAEALRARDEARRAQEEERRARDQAVAAREQERRAKDQAIAAQQEEEKAKNQAITSQQEEEKAKNRALAAQEREKKAKDQAVAARQEEEKAKRAALRARDNERLAKEETDRLRRLAELEALAGRTISMTQPAVRELAALLAVQAWRLYLADGGEPETTVMYGALHHNLRQLGSGRAGTLGGPSAVVRSLAVAPDGTTVAIGDNDGEVRLIDPHEVPSGRIGGGKTDRSRALPGRFRDGVRGLSFSSDGRFLAAGSRGGVVQVWDLRQDGTLPRVLEGADVPPETWPPIQAIAFSRRGGALAVGDRAGGLRLWDLEGDLAESAARVLRGPSADAPPVHDLAWHGDATLASADDGLGALLWSPGEGIGGEARPQVLAHESAVRSVAWSAGGRRLAAGTEAGAVVVWKMDEPGSDSVLLLGHTARVVALAFHPRRDLLASASLDGSLRLWNLDALDAAPLVIEHDSWLLAAAFLDDGERLVFSGGDRTLELRLTRSEALAEEICRTLTRNLSRQEWNEYLPTGVEYEKTCPDLSEP